MGRWDEDLFSDDMAAGIREAWNFAISGGLSPAAAELVVRGQFKAALDDPDDGPAADGVLSSLRASAR